MTDPFTDKFEIQKRRELAKLMEDWKKVVSTKSDIIFPDDGKEYRTVDYFYSDGFYPGYFSSNPKVLFFAREARWASGKDRILSDLECLKTPSDASYWRRIMYMTYGIQTKGKYKFSELPSADEIYTNMKAKNNYGFAIMNISKYSNDSDSGGTADYNLINRFLVDSELDKRNFIREEIALLDPDVIISANLWGGSINYKEFCKFFPEHEFKIIDRIENKANLSDFKFNGKTIKFIDTFHFSAIGSDEDLYYNPVMKFLFG